ncbi:hypothetical protein ACOME3_002992 [Neoechinorhynchus agilis]
MTIHCRCHEGTCTRRRQAFFYVMQNVVVTNRGSLFADKMSQKLESMLSMDGDSVGEGRKRLLVDEIRSAALAAMESVLSGRTYDSSQVNRWMSEIIEGAINRLIALSQNFKYIINCTIMVKNGTCLHVASSCYWDERNDGSCIVKYENDSLYAVASVYGLSI